MWQARGIDREGGRVDVPLRRVDGYPSRDRIVAAARELMGARLPEALLRELGAEDPLPGIDGIESWGARAAELAGELYGTRLVFGPAGHTADGTELPGLLSFEAGELESLAFHGPDALIADVSGLAEIEITEEHGEIPEPQPPLTISRSFLEWRAYLGGGTLVSEGESELEARAGGAPTLRMKLLGAPGALFGRGLGWMGRPSKPSRDRFMHARLRHFEGKHPEVAKRYPDLGMYRTDPQLFRAIRGRPPDGAALVFVHGTFSCAVPNLAVLEPLAMPAWRFEHDTFLSVADNAQRLAQAAAEYLGRRPLHLVAHSRGGLVARLAARELAADGHQVTVRTYGTPHKGTPLANAGGRMLAALLAMGRTAAGGAFTWDPASLAGKLAFKALTWSKLPEGLDVMRTDSDTLRTMNLGREPFPLISYGGEYDLRRLADGACAYALGEVLAGGFGGDAHDLVVPTASALGAGQQRPALPCDHFGYFATAALRDELRALA